MNLTDLISAVPLPDGAAGAAARARWNSLAKPLGGLGLLEDAVVRMAAAAGSPDVHLTRPVLLVFCADNGVVAQGVSQSTAEVTRAVASALGAGTSTVCHMAKAAGCRVLPVDMGILNFPGAPGVLDRRVRNGTADLTLGPAMDRAECLRAMETGISLAERLRREGTAVLAAGEMGIGNTTTSSAVVSVLLNLPPELVTGRGAGLSDTGLQNKLRAIRTGITVNRPDFRDPVDVLTKVGGLDLAALCGTFLGCALYRMPVLLDGLISLAAALCAVRMCPAAGGVMLASHLPAEPGGTAVLEALGLRPLISAGMHLGEGSGAVAALPLLEMALAVYNSGHTFDILGIDAYTPQRGKK